ncbi:MAG: hypothetical protein ABI468_02965 [Candidatus Nanopelagicales bacterium]
MAQQRGSREVPADAPGGRRPASRSSDPESSRVGIDAARRARDVSRPDARDLEQAESSVVTRRARPVA